MKIEEIEFKGSSLEHEIKYCSFPTNFYRMIKAAHERKPESKFWKEAFDLIDKKYQRHQKRIAKTKDHGPNGN